MKIETQSQLRELYNNPSGRASKKELPALEKHAINFIETSPFLVVSTFSKDGKADTSPRGGQPGFVKVLNNNEIVIPDAKGNNRLDSLVNIIETGRVGTLFLIPGVDETMRINGKAYLSTDTQYLDLFEKEKHPPKACIIIEVEEVFIHCAKAFMRSKLWSKEAQINRSDFPTIGQILKDQLGSKDTPESQEEMLKRYREQIE